MQDLDKIKLTDEQKNCVDFEEDADLLVRGVAGSGKSLVILKRALKTAKNHLGENKHIVIYTYTHALEKYTKELVQMHPELKKSISVHNTDSIWWDIYDYFYKKGPYTKCYYTKKKDRYNRENPLYSTLKETISAIRKKISNRFLDSDMLDFVHDELSWIKQHSDTIQKRSDYMNCKRTGRGRSIVPTKDDREIIYSIYVGYYNRLKEKGLKDVDSVCAEISQNLDKIPINLKHDYVMVDECQDLSLSQLRIIKGLSRRSMTLCADFNQKIYSHSGFTWSEFGIDLRRSNAKKLKGTFRNTKQIALLAGSLKTHIQKLDEDIDTDDVLPTREGPWPVVHFMRSESDEVESIIRLINDIQSKNPDHVIGMLFPTNRMIEEWQVILLENGVKSEVIKANDSRSNNRFTTHGVKLITYYSAKGLEFDEVILPRVVAEIYPFKSYRKNASEETNEYSADTCRNAFYVAMTRARFELHIYTDQTTRYNPSEFIYELDEQYYVKTNR